MSLRIVGRNGLLASAGLAVLGLSTVVITAVAARAFPGAPFAVFLAWWMVSLTVGLCFTVLEIYLPKVLGDAILASGDGRPVQVTMARRLGLAVGIITTVALVIAPWSVPRWFNGNLWLLVLAILYTIILSLQSFQRGVAVARGRFTVLTSQMATEALLRVTIAITLALTGQATPAWMAVGIVLSAAVSLGAGRAIGGPWWAWRGTATTLRWFPLATLFGAAVGPAIMNNATVPWLVSQSGLDPFAVGAFAGALLLSRIPIMFVGAVYAPVIRPLADASAVGDSHGFRRTYRLTIAFGASLALLFALAGWLLGPWAVGIYLGPRYVVSSGVTTLLALTSGIGFMGAGTQAAVVAQGRWHANLWASGAALLGFGTALAVLPLDPPLVAASAGLLGTVLIVSVMMAHVKGASLVPSRPPADRATGKGTKTL